MSSFYVYYAVKDITFKKRIKRPHGCRFSVLFYTNVRLFYTVKALTIIIAISLLTKTQYLLDLLDT